MAGRVVEALAGIARLAALAGITTAQAQVTLEALERVALAEVLVVVVVALRSSTAHCILRLTQPPKVGTAEVSALRGLVRAARAGLVASTIPLLVVWAQADRLEQLGHSLPQGFMAAEPLVETLDTSGKTKVTPVDQFKLLDTSLMAALAQSVSCGAVVDPILLTQRTYNQ